jgi:formylglycine-generating enzyme required for sulfatase activity
MKRPFFLSFFIAISLCLAAQTKVLYVNNGNGSVTPPSNEKRFALVVGNNSYVLTPLKNPVNDAKAMSTTLETLGFEVETITDASRSAMTGGIQRLAKKAQGANCVAMFFYSGHGLQVSNDNFLVPIDASVQSEPDVEVTCLSLNYLMRQLEQANSGMNIIVLDACRNNPFGYNRSGGGGLASPSRTPSGTYIAFATAPLTTAVDGTGSNSPYTMALLKAIKEPNIKIEDAFKQVRREVKRIGQTPWESSSMDGDFYFNPQPSTVVTPQNDPPKPTPQYKPPVVTSSTPKNADFTETATGVSFSMKYITGNTFKMGSNESDDEKPIQAVRVGTFFMSKYEVTFNEYDKFCEATNRTKPSDEGWGRGNHPVINVSWDAAVAYCEWLSSTTGKKYRLPTEAEWEYSARGGQSFKYAGSDNVTDMAWCATNSGNKTHDVGTKNKNGFGLYDMSGNVWEWCSDWYKGYSGSSGVKDYVGLYRINRGGSWGSDDRCRSTFRNYGTPVNSNNNLGFRVCLSLK